MLYEILVEEVVGWDMRKDSPSRQTGHFGTLFAFPILLRNRTKRVFTAIYLSGLKDLMIFNIHCSLENKKEKQAAKQTIQKYMEKILTTELFPSHPKELKKFLIMIVLYLYIRIEVCQW